MIQENLHNIQNAFFYDILTIHFFPLLFEGQNDEE